MDMEKIERLKENLHDLYIDSFEAFTPEDEFNQVMKEQYAIDYKCSKRWRNTLDEYFCEIIDKKTGFKLLILGLCK